MKRYAVNNEKKEMRNNSELKRQDKKKKIMATYFTNFFGDIAKPRALDKKIAHTSTRKTATVKQLFITLRNTFRQEECNVTG